MPTDDNQPSTGSPSPFARRPITWGRPPATVFRAGPLPKGQRLPPLPEPPKVIEPSRATILSGSLIPSAAAGVVTPARAPAPAKASPSAADSLAAASVRSPVAAPDLVVRPLAPPEAAAAPGRPNPSSADMAPAARPAPAPAPAPVRARPRRASRAPLYAGTAAAVLGAVALGGWMLTRAPAPTPAAPPSAESLARAPVATAAAPPIDAAPLAKQSTLDARPVSASGFAGAAPATVERPSPALAARRPAQARPSAPLPSETLTTVPAPEAEPVTPGVEPKVEIIPAGPPGPPGPPPTTAERPPADPDAPIATRPQPLSPAANPGG